MRADLGVLAEILGSNSTAALDFRDQDAGAELLSGLHAKQHIVAAYLYLADDRLFASYLRDPELLKSGPSGVRSDAIWFDNDRLRAACSNPRSASRGICRRRAEKDTFPRLRPW
jgi:hypothetical protein